MAQSGVVASRRFVLPFLACAVGLAALLTIPYLDATSMWSDEGWSLTYARLNWPDFWIAIHHMDAVFILYYAAMHEWLRFGESLLWLRLFSTLCFLASLPIAFLVARRMFGSTTAIVTTLLLGTNNHMITHAKEMRSYTCAFLFAILATYFFLKLIEQGGTTNIVMFVATAALAIFAHAFVAMFFMAQALSVWVLPHTRRGSASYIIALLLLALIVVPYAFFVKSLGMGQIDWIGTPNLREIGHALFSLSGGRFQGTVAAIAVIALLMSPRRSRVGLVPVIWTTVPFCLLLAFSYLIHPAFVDRYLFALAFPFDLAIAAAVGLLSSQAVRGCTIGLLVTISAFTIWSDRFTERENYRAAARYIAAHQRPGDVLMGGSPMLAFDRAVAEQGLPLLRSQLLPSPDWSVPFRGPNLADADPLRLHKTSGIWFVNRGERSQAIIYDMGRDLEKQILHTAEFSRVSFRQFVGVSVSYYVRRAHPVARVLPPS